MAGQEPTYIPIAAKDPLAIVALPKWDCYHYMIELGQVPPEWVNKVTVKRYRHFQLVEGLFFRVTTSSSLVG